ncbi:putative membrane protein [Spirosoma lacussanchae]|uniref:SdpI family protein n=1 Tax=Spirosoma lacussanchae TaxID=1884249 RepID=UPI0011090D9E|nr:SdpI family protein [Spirosoma lacussanchae]
MIWILPAVIVPLVILFCGILYATYPPKKINFLYGYRTKKSMLNNDIWTTANSLAAKSLIIVQVSILIIIIVIALLERTHIIKLFSKATDFYLVSMVVSTVSVLLPIFIVEFELKKQFYKDGTRKISK